MIERVHAVLRLGHNPQIFESREAADTYKSSTPDALVTRRCRVLPDQPLTILDPEEGEQTF